MEDKAVVVAEGFLDGLTLTVKAFDGHQDLALLPDPFEQVLQASWVARKLLLITELPLTRAQTTPME